MYRPQSLDITHKGGNRHAYIGPFLIPNEGRRLIREFPSGHGLNINQRLCVGQWGNICYRDKCHWLTHKMGNMDYHFDSNIPHNPYGSPSLRGFCHSQSFSVSKSFNVPPSSTQMDQETRHISRLTASTYMSPPSPYWTPVGNIVTVKRSVSMPGRRSRDVSMSLTTPHTNSDVNSSAKKKFRPLKCLRYQFRRGWHKDSDAGSNKEMSKEGDACVFTPSVKESKSFFKKKTDKVSDKRENTSSVSRGIKKSISFLFSRSNRSSRSDPSFEDQSDTHMKCKNRCTPSERDTRRDRSYESMRESDKKSSSKTNTQAAVSVDDIERIRSPSERSLSDSLSVYSSDQQLSVQSSGCHRSASSQINDYGWKMVVGPVCRSISKDSAIANSTLSGDGIVDPSKRISLTSTTSGASNRTTASEEFNDSSYSSFNDLQTNSSQFSHPTNRKNCGISNLKSISVTFKTTKSHKVPESSPSSDSSTETLRPLSCGQHRTQATNQASRTNIIRSRTSLSTVDRNSKCHKRSYSWPGCSSNLNSLPLTFNSEPPSKHRLPPLPLKSNPKIVPCLNVKLSTLQQSRVNSSPFLSQYSRLYSLQFRPLEGPTNLPCGSGPPPGAVQPSTSQIKYVSAAETVTLRRKNPC